MTDGYALKKRKTHDRRLRAEKKERRMTGGYVLRKKKDA